MSERELSPTSLYAPSKRGISIRSGARKNRLNVYSRLREENPRESIGEIVKKVSELTGVSKRIVFRLKKALSAVSCPSKKRLLCRLTAPKGKGRSLIIIHIGSKEGFVRDADIFIWKKSGDYHEEIDGNHFEKWFETVMPELKPQSIIVMDNAFYHSLKKEKIPTST
ncbi:DDE_3 domain-containing protein [Trichonephila inaurata madagascariensis]|uniref:DDE_3 domain-containing protein n=1 Tax=Trichonephila inaurata madagascariensis TaxID=2747483 RepID=A0A8X6XJJ3_9ARAC|nr:DDE_3 domain-containing protein [Trichonephila inaurata madagascariensis]